MSFINNLNNTDFVVLLIILIAMIYGYIRGVIREVLSIFSIFLSGYLSIFFYPYIALFITKYVEMGIVADIISLSILFFFIYSSFNVIIRFVTKKIHNSSLEIFDKNFGILFGFIKVMFLLSVLNIIMLLTFWKTGYPSWANDSKSLNVIGYSSSLVLKLTPQHTLEEFKRIFGLKELPYSDNVNANQPEEYGEPNLKSFDTKQKDGYSENDNESLDKLFNIENND